MALVIRIVLAIMVCFSASCFAQDWQLGGGGGYSFYKDVTASNSSGDVKTGFKGGYAFTAIGGHDLYKWVGGELRYEYLQNDGKVSGNGQDVTFGGHSHAVHYDVILNAAPKGSKIRPFGAVGGGIKYYRGTGEESAYQPLGDFVVLTRTSEFKPLFVAGGGVKFQMNERITFRAEFYDFMTPAPTKVITPVPGTTMGGWFHNFVPMFGVTFGIY